MHHLSYRIQTTPAAGLIRRFLSRVPKKIALAEQVKRLVKKPPLQLLLLPPLSGNDTKESLNFIPLSQFPKLPSEFQTTHGFLQGKGFSPPPLLPLLLLVPNSNHLINFQLRDDQSKSRLSIELSRQEQALLEGVDSFVTQDEESGLASCSEIDRLLYEAQTQTYYLQPHPLRTSILGMITFNKPLDDMKDECLWELFPQDKLFGVAPFEQKCDPGNDSFIKWEQEMITKKQIQQSAYNNRRMQILDFKASLQQPRSLYIKSGARRKIDRKMVKKYLRLEKDIGSGDNDDFGGDDPEDKI